MAESVDITPTSDVGNVSFALYKFEMMLSVSLHLTRHSIGVSCLFIKKVSLDDTDFHFLGGLLGFGWLFLFMSLQDLKHRPDCLIARLLHSDNKHFNSSGQLQLTQAWLARQKLNDKPLHRLMRSLHQHMLTIASTKKSPLISVAHYTKLNLLATREYVEHYLKANHPPAADIGLIALRSHAFIASKYTKFDNRT